MTLEIHPIPCLKDNYAYLLVCSETGQAAVVDPGEAEPVVQTLWSGGWTLSAILNTHHHWDHTGGNEDLIRLYPEAAVYGFLTDADRIPGLTCGLEDGETFDLGRSTIKALHVPGHTLDALAYRVEGSVFTGDTLFGGGCGRLFEGTPAQMSRSLGVLGSTLPPETHIYFGHEYTLKNLQFAQTVEAGNSDLQQRLNLTADLRARGQPSVPSTVGLELATNPFLRCQSPEILRNLQQDHGLQGTDAVDVLASLRGLKDRF